MSQQELHIHPVERTWIIIGIVMLVVFAGAVFISGFGYGFQLPAPAAIVNPALVATPGATSFGEAGVKELSPGNYEVYVLAQMWQFTPATITVPQGSRVTFYVTSKDVQHGFKIQGTNINMMALPGEVGRLTATFDTPGTYNFLCHEYCGALHHTMYGQLVVTE